MATRLTDAERAGLAAGVARLVTGLKAAMRSRARSSSAIFPKRGDL